MSRERFLKRIRNAVQAGLNTDNHDELPFPYGSCHANLESKCKTILNDAFEKSDNLFDQLAKRAESSGWRVVKLSDLRSVGEYVSILAAERNSGSVVASGQEVIQNIELQDHVDTDVFFIQKSMEDAREKCIEADIGVTGVEYAIAETGTCVLTAGDRLNRLVALTPPVHVAVVTKGQVLPSLDELFVLRQKDSKEEAMPAYTNLISGPSRSADIEYKLITGVHGPGEVHLVLVNES